MRPLNRPQQSRPFRLDKVIGLLRFEKSTSFEQNTNYFIEHLSETLPKNTIELIGKYKKVVVVGADKMSSITNYRDRNTCVLFGDAAGAVLLASIGAAIIGLIIFLPYIMDRN